MSNQHLDKDDPLRGKTSGKWTKHGGAIYGLRKEAIKDNWYCQTCSDEVPKELPPFNYELYPGEFIRICNTCQNKINLMNANPGIIKIRRVIQIRRSKRD